MTRTQRLLTLLQLLKENRYPMTAERLAAQCDVSVRSIYRDIATLRQQGAEIVGEAGIGFLYKSGLLLPPLLFDIAELEALVLGLRWVESHGDNELAASAKRAADKISGVVNQESQSVFQHNSLFAPSSRPSQVKDPIAIALRRSLREECKIRIKYQDQTQQLTQRVIWPVALGYMHDVQVIAAWCELRGEYRHFRLDRINELFPLTDKYPYPKGYLLAQWRKSILTETPDKN